MENKKFLKVKVICTALAITLITGFLFLQNVQSYGSKCTHPKLTKNIAKIYNQNFDPDLSDEQIKWMMWGAEHEDLPPRYIHHFYDPINNKGWKGNLTAKQWAQDFVRQSMPGFHGDYSWNRAIYEYQQNNYEYAFKALGHVLHLIEDMSVPAHTRDDTHLPFEGLESPYEEWAKGYCATHGFNFASQPVIYDNLDSYFDNLALYSNNYFYSIDSVEKYPRPLVAREGISYLYGRDENGAEFKLLEKASISWRNLNEKVDYKLDDSVNLDYFQRLGSKSVAYGAGIVKLFFDEAGKQEIQEPESAGGIVKVFINKTVNKVKSFVQKTGQGIVNIFQSKKSDDIGAGLMSPANNQITNNKSQINNKAESVNLESGFENETLMPFTEIASPASQARNDKGDAEGDQENNANAENQQDPSLPEAGQDDKKEEAAPQNNANNQQAAPFIFVPGSASYSAPDIEPELEPEPEPDLCGNIECTDQCFENNLWSYTCDSNTGNCIPDSLKESCEYGCENNTCLPEPEEQEPEPEEQEPEQEEIEEPEPEPEPDITPPEIPSIISPQIIGQSILTNASTTRLLGIASQDTEQILIYFNNATSTISQFNATSTPNIKEFEFDLNIENATTSLQIIAKDEFGNQSESLNLQINYDYINPIAYIAWTGAWDVQNLALIYINVLEHGYEQYGPGGVLLDQGLYTSAIQKIEIQKKINNQEWQDWQTILQPEINYSDHPSMGGIWFVQIALQGEPGNTYQIKAKAYDQAGNMDQAQVWTDWDKEFVQIDFPAVVINEVAWMGMGSTPALRNDEWIELYNYSDQDIDLNEWTLENRSRTIELDNIIPANSYYLLERTDDNSVPGISADQTYSGNFALDNDGDYLNLRTDKNILIDYFEFEEEYRGWPAGDNTTKQTMERINAHGLGNDPDNWATSIDVHGTPKAKNSATP